MDQSDTEVAVRSNGVVIVPHTELAPLPSECSKVLGLDPFNFLRVINASGLAAWAVEVTSWRRPALYDLHKRGPKQTYSELSSIRIPHFSPVWLWTYGGPTMRFRRAERSEAGARRLQLRVIRRCYPSSSGLRQSRAIRCSQ
jgi:hypothetical protein